MNTDHILNILSTDQHSRPSFRGVFPRDSFVHYFSQKQPPLVSRYVVNFDKSKDDGSHWVVVEFDQPTAQIFYFDPYGLPPLFPGLFDSFADKSADLHWNAVQFQGLNSTVCGQYCVLYCLLRARSIPFENVIDVLHHSPQLSKHARDHCVYELLNSLYPQQLKDLNVDVHDIQVFS